MGRASGDGGFLEITPSLWEHVFFQGVQVRWASMFGGLEDGVGPRGDGLADVKMEEKESGLLEDLGRKKICEGELEILGCRTFIEFESRIL
jgi:hypothetical protein